MRIAGAGLHDNEGSTDVEHWAAHTNKLLMGTGATCPPKEVLPLWSNAYLHEALVDVLEPFSFSRQLFYYVSSRENSLHVHPHILHAQPLFNYFRYGRELENPLSNFLAERCAVPVDKTREPMSIASKYAAASYSRNQVYACPVLTMCADWQWTSTESQFFLVSTLAKTHLLTSHKAAISTER